MKKKISKSDSSQNEQKKKLKYVSKLVNDYYDYVIIITNAVIFYIDFFL